MINRKEEIRKKGFSMSDYNDTNSMSSMNRDFSKIKLNGQTLEDAILDLGVYKKVNARIADKKNILNAINESNYIEMREISNFFYKTSGIYSRLCRYMAFLYKYDWLLTPYINDETSLQKNGQEEKMLVTFSNALKFLDDFGIKKFFNEVALTVIKNGCYYGYLVDQGQKIVVQELPSKYCRSRFYVNNHPAIEFNMKYFDDMFKDTTQRNKMLNIFSEEIKKGYILYKKGKLPPQFKGDTSGWYLLDPNNAIKFNLNGEDMPAFMPVIPNIIDLDEAKGLDKKRMAQKLLKVIIQKMPLDKNGDLVFDVDEAQELHRNAVNMLSKAIGLDVLTTFAEVDVADLSDKGNISARDELEKVERAVYNEAGVSQMQFNTSGNLALEKSILNDESTMYNLVLQFEQFLNLLLDRKGYNKNYKKYSFSLQIIPTTIYNYKELSKLYKEQTQLGYSKMLPQIALGQSQSSILANAYFENKILDLVHLFIPPISSSTMSADSLSSNSDSTGGRPKKEDDEKSEKTIMNEESQS